MQQMEWVISKAPEPIRASQVGEVSGLYRQVKGLYLPVEGIYAANINGSECVLMLWHNQEGFVHGSFAAEDEALEVRGGFSPETSEIQGYMFEPFGMLPVAIFSARQKAEGLSVEIGVLEFASVLESTKPEHLEFSQVRDIED
jgi:hypothetical protein